MGDVLDFQTPPRRFRVVRDEAQRWTLIEVTGERDQHGYSGVDLEVIEGLATRRAYLDDSDKVLSECQQARAKP